MFSARLSFKALELWRPKWNYKWLSQVSAASSHLQVLDKGGVRHITLADPKTSGSVGIFCSTPGIPLVRSVPRKVSAHMLLTGLPITAEEALRAGLVSKLVSENELETETLRTVEAITHKSKAVIALGKKFMYKQIEMGIEEAYSEGSCLMVNNVNMKDGQEGIGSFIEKRKPSWFHSEE